MGWYTLRMAYQKTIWQGRTGENLDKYLKYDETDTSVVLVNAPDSIDEPGTPFSTDNMNHIENGIKTAHDLIAAEEQARIQGDADTLATAKNYANEQIANTVAATQIWLPAVDTFALLPVITDTSKNWLCRVRDAQTVYQCVAGQTTWVEYSDQNDFVNELEMEGAIGDHNGSIAAHPGIRAAIAAEINAREVADQDLQGRLESLAPEGMDNLPALLAAKAPTNHASAAATYGAAAANIFGHMRFPPPNGVPPEAGENGYALPYSYITNNVFAHQLNYYLTPGVYAIKNLCCDYLGLPNLTDWERGYKEFALLVLPFDGSTQVRQVLHMVGSRRIFTRYSTGVNTWSAFEEIAYLNNPVFTGAPKVKAPGGNQGNLENPIAVVAATTVTNETSLPVGAYILALYSVLIQNFAGNRNVQVYPKLSNSSHVYELVSSGMGNLSGTWLSSGAITLAAPPGDAQVNVVLCRRVA